MIAPVIYDESGPIKNEIVPAISSGDATRFNGTSCSRSSLFCFESPANIAVSTNPGARILTLFPCGPTACAKERAHIANAAFDAE